MVLGLSLLTGGSVGLVTQAAPQEATYRYEFEQPNFPVTHIVVVLDAAGRGSLEYSEKDTPEPVRVPITLRSESLVRLQRLATQVAGLPPVPPSDKHANLGLSKLTLLVNGAPVSIAFTYTQQPAVAELGRFFRGLVTQHQRINQIETARRYQPLDMPQLLSHLEADLNAQRIAEPTALADLLASLANDLRLSLIARNQARRLYTRVNGK